MNKLTYLAVPYTWNPNKSFEIANKVAAKLMDEGKNIISPISHSHPIADYLNPELRINQEFWMNQDLPILSKCDELLVIVIGDNGIDLINNSKGCQSEIKESERLNKPINYYQYHE